MSEPVCQLCGLLRNEASPFCRMNTTTANHAWLPSDNDDIHPNRIPAAASEPVAIMVTKARLINAFEALPYRKFPYSSLRVLEIVDLLFEHLSTETT